MTMDIPGNPGYPGDLPERSAQLDGARQEAYARRQQREEGPNGPGFQGFDLFGLGIIRLGADQGGSVYLGPLRFGTGTARDGTQNVYLGVPHIGVTPRGSLDVGAGAANIVDVNGKLGPADTGASVDAGVGPIARVHGGVGAGFDERGLHAGVSAHGDALGVVGAGADVHARVGRNISAGGDVRGHVGPIYSGAGTYGSVGLDGVHQGINTRGGVAGVAGASVREHVALDQNSSAGVDTSGYALGSSARVGAGIATDGNQYLRPYVYAQGRNPAVVYQPQRTYPPQVGYQPQATEQVAPAVPPPASIETQPLYEPATPESIARYERYARQQLIHQSTVVARPGESYLDVLMETRPNENCDSLRAEVPFIQHINGNKPIHAGMHVATLSPEEIDWKTRVAVCQHFGWAPPES